MTKDQTPSATFIRRRRQPSQVGKGNNKNKTIPMKQIEIDGSQTVGPRIIRAVSSSEWTLFLSLLAFRLINSVLIQTSFVPDEHWQSVEVAHNLAFGYGYLTWEWQYAIRSPIFPLCFAVIFKLLSIIGLDSRLLIVKLPLLIMGCLAAVADLSLYRFSHRLGGQSVAQYALICQLLNWFTLFTAPRTLINSLEWALTLISLSHFPALPRPAQCSGTHMKNEWRFITSMAICILLRPTAVVQWFPICMWHIYAGWQNRRLKHLILIYIIVGSFTLCLSAFVEKSFYGRWTLSQINFVHFNVFADIAKFYGVHPWHWYWSQGWPVLLGTQLPLFLYACYHFRNEISERLLIFVIVWSIYIYSFSAHKEFRFLFPLLPLALHLCGRALESITMYWRKIILISILITHIPLSLYTCLVHQRGALDLMSAIGRDIERSKSSNDLEVPQSLLFLMPCHATPYYSHLHFNISMRFLKCEPNINKETTFSEEQNDFFKSPITWLQNEYPFEAKRPDRLIMYDNLYLTSRLELFLMKSWRYRKCGTFFHSHFSEKDSRHGKYIYMFCKIR